MSCVEIMQPASLVCSHRSVLDSSVHLAMHFWGVFFGLFPNLCDQRTAFPADFQIFLEHTITVILFYFFKCMFPHMKSGFL